MNQLSTCLEQQMQEMKTMFEDKFKELKQKNKVMFN